MRTTFLLALLALGPALQAQLGTDPKEKIREIADKIVKDMQEIDRLLLRTSAGGQQAAKTMEKNAQRIEKLLQQTDRSHEQVVKGIDSLIREIRRMTGRSSSQGEPSDREQNRQRRPGQSQGRRQRTRTPDMVRREQSGEEPRQRRDQGKNPAKGQNQPAKHRRDDPKERVGHGSDSERWGVLPPYFEFLKRRGGSPKVPEKYRKFHEAYLKQGSRKKK